MAQLNHNSAGGETQASFDPIPNDWYNVAMTASEMKPTNAGDGAYLECVVKVIDGAYAGRLLWIRLNLDNPSQAAVDIAYKQLNSICEATGVIQVGDSEEFHGIPFQVKVIVRPPKGDYEASNEVKGFKAIEGGATAGKSSGAATTNGAGKTGSKPAWAKKDKPVEKKAEVKEEAVKEEVAENTTVEEDPVVEEKKEEGETTTKPPWMT